MENTIELNDTLICGNSKPLEGNDVAPPLTEGNEYPLSEIHTCSCGRQHYNVGLTMVVNFVRCYNCAEELPEHTHWCHPSRFTKKA